MDEKKINSFVQFYPYYLLEHSKPGTKLLHFIGTLLVLINLIAFIIYFNFIHLMLAPILGYGFAWFSHFFIEKNKPATFKYPIYSLRADFVMFGHIILGKVKIFNN
tara:strand:+ start:152 stop:469 length:318 start_codon:yes stop_codon:yes gene_type:complete